MKHPPYRSWNSLVDAVDACQRCPIALDEKIFGDGDTDTEIVLVGEGPGKDEVRYTTPFVGRAGKLLNDALGPKWANMSRAALYLTNVLRCRSADLVDRRWKDRRPLPEEMANCSPFLYATLRFIKPKVIVALGEVAMQALLDPKAELGRKLTIGKVRKRVDKGEKFHFEARWGKPPVIIAWHPSFVSRSHSTARFEELVNDLKRANRLAKRL